MPHDLEEPSARLFGGRPRPVLSAVSTRLGIRAAINSGKFTPDQVAALQQVHDDGDLLRVVSQKATEAGIADPTDPTTPAPKRDWGAFFTALGNFLVQIMPLILKLLTAFGLGAAASSTTALPTVGASSAILAKRCGMFGITIPPGLSALFLSELENFGEAELAFLVSYSKGRIAALS